LAGHNHGDGPRSRDATSYLKPDHSTARSPEPARYGRVPRFRGALQNRRSARPDRRIASAQERGGLGAATSYLSLPSAPSRWSRNAPDRLGRRGADCPRMRANTGLGHRPNVPLAGRVNVAAARPSPSSSRCTPTAPTCGRSTTPCETATREGAERVAAAAARLDKVCCPASCSASDPPRPGDHRVE
jgi:hypothetical protein